MSESYNYSMPRVTYIMQPIAPYINISTMTIYKDIQGFKDHEKSFNGHKKNCQPYLVYGTRSFIVMNMAVKCYINLVLLPKPLQAFPSHRLFK